MLLQHPRGKYSSTSKTEDAPLLSGHEQRPPLRYVGVMKTECLVDITVSNSTNGSDTASTHNKFTRFDSVESDNTTSSKENSLEVLYRVTDAILFISGLIVVISLFVTFATVGIATYRIVFGHVGERPADIHQVLQHIHNAVNVTSEDFNFLNRLITNKKQ